MVAITALSIITNVALVATSIACILSEVTPQYYIAYTVVIPLEPPK